MTKKYIGLILLICAALSAGCGSERALELVAPQPPAPAVLAGLKVTPRTIAMFTEMTTPISLVAVDRHGYQLVWADDALTCSSSNPAVVTVDNRGILTAISAGTAVIGITLTLNGVTATDSVSTDVLEFRPGNYQLTAPITESGWGVSGSYTALLTLWQDSSLTGAGAPTGTFSNLRLPGLDGVTEESVPGGIVEYNVDGLGRLRVQLVAGHVLWSGGIESSLDDSFGGSFAVGDGFAGGRFTAKRGGH
jgi:hypothetical protein